MNIAILIFVREATTKKRPQEKTDQLRKEMNQNNYSMPWPLLSAKSQPVLSPVSVLVDSDTEGASVLKDHNVGGKTYINVLISMFYDNISTNKNNDKYHETFNTIPQDELLIAKFDCALNRGDNMTQVRLKSEVKNEGNESEIRSLDPVSLENSINGLCPYIGTLYISQDHLCFNTKNFQNGWLFTRLQISFKQIVNISLWSNIKNSNTSNDHDDKENDKYIVIETHLGRIQLNGFANVEHVFNLVNTIWQNKRQNIDNDMIILPSLYNLIKDSNKFHDDLDIIANNVRIEDLINSIDSESDISHGEEESEYESEEDESGGEDILDTVPVYKLKTPLDLNYKYLGPYYHKDTNFIPPPLQPNETLIKDELFKSISPGLLFELIFSGHELSFQTKLLDSEGSTQVTEYGPYIEGHREYSYVKKLNYSIGPKSTKCEVQHTIVRYDKECIEWISRVKTPNVPNGNLFQIKNRFIFYWGDIEDDLTVSNSCRMRISYWIEWSGKSWLRSVIEKSCKQGILESQERFDQFLKEYIDTYLVLSSVTVESPSRESQTETLTQEKQEEEMEPRLDEKTEKIGPKKIRKELDTNNDVKVVNTTPYRRIDIILCVLLVINLLVLLTILKILGRGGNNNNNNINNRQDVLSGNLNKEGKGLLEMLIHSR